MSDAERGPDAPQPRARRAGFWATLKAVMWAFLGVRRRDDYHLDASSLDPKAVIVAGLLGGLVFVLTLVAVVTFVVRA
ncbi:DUF2970 domain-containing protein [Aromatoleum sp.]|uniref:DUF2970 domain-containing protein n=1 Tax=Aromatoleum sp. TaxID=2307007 RepID=UPI002FC6AEF5